MSLIRKGDKVVVVSGAISRKTKLENRVGEVLEVLPREDRVIVKDVKIVTKHEKVRPNQKGGQDGGLTRVEAPIHLSNVMYLDPVTNKPVRLGMQVQPDGTKKRVTRGRNSSGSVID